MGFFGIMLEGGTHRATTSRKAGQISKKWRNILKGAGGKNDKRGAGGGRAGKDWAVQDVVYSDLDRGEDQLSEFWWLRVDVI
jgi:hypothetical protein